MVGGKCFFLFGWIQHLCRGMHIPWHREVVVAILSLVKCAK